MERVVPNQHVQIFERPRPGVRRLLALACMVVVVMLLLLPPKALADKFNTETSASADMLGMGNAGINVSRGPYSVFYNPANIAAKDTGVNIQAVNFQLDASEALLSQISNGNFNFTGLGGLATGLRDRPNTFVGGRVSVYPNVTIRNFSIGMLYEVNQGALYQAHDGALRVKARNRFGPVAALSTRLFSGILRFGASAQLLTVGNAEARIAPPLSSNLDYKNVISSHSGLSLAGGGTVTLPIRFLPSFSFVLRDIGDTRYSGTPLLKFGDVRAPYTQPMTLDFGSSLTFYLARRLEMKLAFDYRDLTNQLKGSYFRHVFTGSEFIFFDLLRFRVGMGHGYPSFGFGLNAKKASIDLAVYSDELDDKLRGAREQRYVLQYTWGLFK